MPRTDTQMSHKAPQNVGCLKKRQQKIIKDQQIYDHTPMLCWLMWLSSLKIWSIKKGFKVKIAPFSPQHPSQLNLYPNDLTLFVF